MRSRSRPFRTPVVRVVAAFMPLSGCADEHDLSDYPPNPPNYPPVVTCTVGNGGCVPPLDGGDASRLHISGNTCPAQQPFEGQPCAVPAGKVCEYGAGTKVRAGCESGRWEVLSLSYNPPPSPVACPDAEPAVGEACPTGWPSRSCDYGTCDGGPAATYVCGGSWLVTRHCPAPCPAEPPEDRSPCSTAKQHCGYGDCYGYPTVTADCFDRSWRIGQFPCHPLPPSTCPALVPPEGFACRHVGASCWYEQQRSVDRADCINGSWRIARSPNDAG